MIHEIVRYGHPVLWEKGKKITTITAETAQLASDMLETMYTANGVGLAAQQINRALQICVIDITGADRASRMWFSGVEVNPEDYMPLVMINPRIKLLGENEAGVEGCLSFPGIGGDILRQSRVDVITQTLDGTELRFTCEGLLSRAIQHEVDHLNGILFTDKMLQRDKAKAKPALRKLLKETRDGLGIKD